MKTIHLASLISPDGNVSALCYLKPHAIDLSSQSWTILPEAVTCGKCKAALRDNTEFMLKKFTNPVCGECGGRATFDNSENEWRHILPIKANPLQQFCPHYGYPLKSVRESDEGSGKG